MEWDGPIQKSTFGRTVMDMQGPDRNCSAALLPVLIVVLSAMAVASAPAAIAGRATDTVPPVARFISNVSVAPAGHLVEFNATTSTDNTGIVLYEWDFGDNTAEVSGKGSAASVVSHIFASEGKYLVTLEVSDAAGNKNETRSTFTVTPPLIFADLYLSELGFSNNNPVNGTVTKITIKVGNRGEKSAANFTVRFLDGTRKVQDVFVQSVEAGQAKTLSVDWTPISPGEHSITIHADALSVIAESDETNNLVEASQPVADAGTGGTGSEQGAGTQNDQVPMIAALLVAVIVLAAVVAFLLVRRRSPARAEDGGGRGHTDQRESKRRRRR